MTLFALLRGNKPVHCWLQVAKVDLLVQVAKDDHRHQSRQLQLGLPAKVWEQAYRSSYTVEFQPVNADESLWAKTLDEVLRSKWWWMIFQRWTRSLSSRWLDIVTSSKDETICGSRLVSSKDSLSAQLLKCSVNKQYQLQLGYFGKRSEKAVGQKRLNETQDPKKWSRERDHVLRVNWHSHE